jgi:hypothetical protein
MDQVTTPPGWVVEDRVPPHPVVHRLQTTKRQLWVGGDPRRRCHASASILRSSDPVRKTVSKSGRRRIAAGRQPGVTRVTRHRPRAERSSIPVEVWALFRHISLSAESS